VMASVPSADRGAARLKVGSCGGRCRRWRWRRTVRLGRRRRWAYRRQGRGAPALEAGGGVGWHVFQLSIFRHLGSWLGIHAVLDSQTLSVIFLQLDWPLLV
jgi:hypothetical protein